MKLADVSIARPVFATMMIAVILVFGINALPKMGIEMMPNVEFPVVTVLTTYPGADPTAVEEKVSRKIEEAVNTLPDIDKLISYSNENVSQVAVQFKLNVPIDRGLQDVRDKVAANRRNLPDDIKDPIIEKLDLGAVPIVTYAVSGPEDMSQTALTRFADKVLKQNFEKVSGVGKVELIGGHPREIHLQLNLTALNAARLTVDDLMQILAGGNIELPGGRIDLQTRELSLRVDNQIRDPREIGEIVLSNVNGAPIFVRDVANVVDTEKDPRSYATVNGKSAVLVQVQKQSGTNIVATAEAVKAEVEKLRPTFPQGVIVNCVLDDSAFIRDAINDSGFDLIYGAILAVLIIGFFLRNRNMTLISAVAIPTSIVGTFSVLQRLNFTFNYLTMLGLSLSVGIVIDDAIVVIENIFRHMEDGEPAMAAAHKATAEIGLAVMATTFTIVAVFIPVAFMEGIMGRFFFQFGVTVAVAVLISLFVSFTLTPMLASRFVHHQPSHGRFYTTIEKLLKGLDAGYARLIRWALDNRGKVALIAGGLLALSVVAVSRVPGEFMSEQDEEGFQVDLETPPGSTLAHTEQLCRVVESVVSKLPGVQLISTAVGGGAREQVNKATLNVRLTPANKRPYSQKRIMKMIREKLPNLPGVLMSVSRHQEISTGQRPETLQLALRGEDLPKMEGAAVRIAERIKKIPGFVDVDTSVRPGKDELRLNVDRQKAAELGVSAAQVALVVRNLVSSAKVGEMAQGEDRYDIRVWLSPEERSRTADLDRIKIRNVMGGMVALSDLVSIAPAKGPTEIERQERQRQVTIYSNLDHLAMTQAQAFLNVVAAEEVPPGITTVYIGYADIMQESMRDMINALILAVILVYIILASQFESFLHPFTIMFSLPFSVIGAFGALLITGSTLSIISMIGIIMLMGLVTKNAILLVDRANQNIRTGGLTRTEALIDAGRVRLRPILMTTFAMIFGMLPVALAMSKGSEIRSPMASAVIGGLITSTLLTLIVVPVIYTFLDDLSAKIAGLARRRRAAATAPASAGGKQ